MALGARHRADARLDDDERVGRVGEAVVFGDDAELHLESDGHAGLSWSADPPVRGRLEAFVRRTIPVSIGDVRPEMAGRCRGIIRGDPRAGRGPAARARRARPARPRRPPAARRARSRSSWATIGASASTTSAKPSRRMTRQAPAAAGHALGDDRLERGDRPRQAELVLEPERARGVGDQVAEPDHRPRRRGSRCGAAPAGAPEPATSRAPSVDRPGPPRPSRSPAAPGRGRRGSSSSRTPGAAPRSAGRGARGAPGRARRRRRRAAGAAGGRRARSAGRARRA